MDMFGSVHRALLSILRFISGVWTTHFYTVWASPPCEDNEMIWANLLTGDHGPGPITSLGPQFVARRPDEADGWWRGWAGGRDVQPPRIPVSRGLASSPLAQQSGGSVLLSGVFSAENGQRLKVLFGGFNSILSFFSWFRVTDFLHLTFPNKEILFQRFHNWLWYEKSFKNFLKYSLTASGLSVAFDRVWRRSDLSPSFRSSLECGGGR